LIVIGELIGRTGIAGQVGRVESRSRTGGVRVSRRVDSYKQQEKKECCFE